MKQVTPVLCKTLEALSFLEGEWNIVCKIRESRDADFDESPASAKTFPILDGKAMQEDFEDDYIKGKNIFCFNSATNKWQNVWIDTDQAYISMAEGMQKDNTFVFEGNDPFHSNAKIRQTFLNITPNSYEWTMEYFDETAQDWWTAMQFNHTRK